jgi:hypothetical protein
MYNMGTNVITRRSTDLDMFCTAPPGSRSMRYLWLRLRLPSYDLALALVLHWTEPAYESVESDNADHRARPSGAVERCRAAAKAFETDSAGEGAMHLQDLDLVGQSTLDGAKGCLEGLPHWL